MGKPLWERNGASCQQWTSSCQSYEWIILVMDPLTPIRPSDDAALDNILSATWEILSQNHQLSFSWTSWPTENCEMIYSSLFQADILLEEFVIKKQMTKIFINHILLITEFLLILFFKYFLSIAHLIATIIVLILGHYHFFTRLLQYFLVGFLAFIFYFILFFFYFLFFFKF